VIAPDPDAQAREALPHLNNAPFSIGHAALKPKVIPNARRADNTYQSFFQVVGMNVDLSCSPTGLCVCSFRQGVNKIKASLSWTRAVPDSTIGGQINTTPVGLEQAIGHNL